MWEGLIEEGQVNLARQEIFYRNPGVYFIDFQRYILLTSREMFFFLPPRYIVLKSKDVFFEIKENILLTFKERICRRRPSKPGSWPDFIEFQSFSSSRSK